MSEMDDYRKHCPTAGEEDYFVVYVDFLIKLWRSLKRAEPAMPRPDKVNKELKALRKAISNLSDYTRQELIIREGMVYPLEPPEFIDEFYEQGSTPERQALVDAKLNSRYIELLGSSKNFPKVFRVISGESSLETLEESLKYDYVRKSSDKEKPLGRSDGQTMRQFGTLVFRVWDVAGGIERDENTGKTSPKDKDKFMDFLEMLSEDVKTTDVGGFDAVTLYKNIFDKRENPMI